MQIDVTYATASAHENTTSHKDYISNMTNSSLIKFHITRTEVATLLKELVSLGRFDVANAKTRLVNFLANLDGHDNEFRKDLEGQVLEAVSRDDWFQRWGVHYLRSLANAHNNQACANFKDPGLQAYKSTYFEEMQSDLDTIFNNMPSVSPSLENKYKSRGLYIPPPTSMASINNVYTDCFHKSASIELADGKHAAISNLTNRSVVKTPNGHSRVRYVTCCKVSHNVKFAAFPGGLKLTEWHPVFIDGKWEHPVNLSYTTVAEEPCNAVYNLVLEKDHIVYANGIQVVTLGHGMKGPVIEHDYYGDKIIPFLEQLEHDAIGTIMYNSSDIIRDPFTGAPMGIFNKFLP